jgi:cyclic beta-1,2-glucan synthetase
MDAPRPNGCWTTTIRCNALLRRIAEDLPLSFYRRLPALAPKAGGSRGPPRAHALAEGLLHASHLQMSHGLCVDFLRAYQTAAPLTIAELWALPTMLRLVCVEVLAEAFGRLFPSAASPLPASKARAQAPDDADRVARAISALAAIDTIRWMDVFDATSLVETRLAEDPAQVYARMDFATRDGYRRRLEDLAARSGVSELAVADAVITRAGGETGQLRRHVGHWLIGDGRTAFEAGIGARRPLALRLRETARRRAGALYALALTVVFTGALAAVGAYLAWSGADPALAALGLALSALPAMTLAVTLVNWLVTRLAAPATLPKLDFRRAIAADCPTAIVIPALVGGAEDATALARRLEAHRLANPDPLLRFVLLSDLPDGASERTDRDSETEAALTAAVARLNARHPGAPFHLLHRPRRFNPAEGVWMGWERKRGKLEQFNAFILTGDATPFSLVMGDAAALRRIRFVATADADTVLPPGSVARLVGTLAHPLNRARVDGATRRVVGGYTILQPRVEIAPEQTTRSAFARLYAGDAAIDIYSRAVSDVYQDLFGVGSFTGKGLYEVAPFAHSLTGRAPENRILSHDLFEGLHGRVALTTDIVVYEGFPATWPELAARQHRWIRGDWQLLPWLGRRVPAADGGAAPTRFSPLDRWKLFDNLRRSLSPPALIALALAGWLVLPGAAWVWTLVAVLTPGAHIFTDLITGLAQGRRRGAMRGLAMRLREHAGRWALGVTFLPAEAALSVDAIARTLCRLAARRRLLEWTPAARIAARLAGRSPRGAAWRAMWPAPALSALAAAALGALNPSSLPVALPLLTLWALSPEIAVVTGRRSAPVEPPLGAADRAYLRGIARRTWLFFETFVRPEDNWLPPDNYQEAAQTGVAHRTSPTNIGMMMLATLTAWRLGHVGLPGLAERMRGTLDTMDRLETHRGHLLNWYETRHLTPLEPRYVSTVDSGNLAVSLVTLAQACRAARDGPPILPARWDGLLDGLALLSAALKAPENYGAFDDGPPEAIRAIETATRAARDDPWSWVAALDDLRDRLRPALEARIADSLAGAGDDLRPEALREAQIWLDRTRRHIAALHRDVQGLEGWRAVAAQAPEAWADRLSPTVADLLADMTLADGPAALDVARTRVLALHDAEEPWPRAFAAALARSADAQRALVEALDALAIRADAWAEGMDFAMLYDDTARLFFIGYNVSHGRMDANRYDLLASEARLASYFAIAKRDVDPEHWFQLGRPVTRDASGLALVSWNGSMFEYLMPRLLMRSHPATLLGQSERTAVDMQRAHAARLGLPWGVSESGYADQDPEQSYRYHAFGAPGLGVRRGLWRDRVVAPYATLLALPVRQRAALANLRAMEALGLVGRYGFFEAVDFTPERVPVGADRVAVRSYMAHHQGMGLAALGATLCDDILARWFESNSRMATMALLLSERAPWEAPREPAREPDAIAFGAPREAAPGLHPWTLDAPDGLPQLHLLGNGSMSSRVTSGGGGGLRWRRHTLTRALGGRHEGVGGQSLLLKDHDDGHVWGLGDHAGDGRGADPWRVVFHQHLAEFHHRERGIALSMLIAVAPGDDVEIRRVTIVNETDRPRRLSLTACAEVILAPGADHDRHPAFSRLFVGAAHLHELDALLFTRRHRRTEEHAPVLLHRVVCESPALRPAGFETDRRAFLGRGGDARHPAALRAEGLSCRTGWTLDTVLARQVDVSLPAHGASELFFVSVAAETRAAAEATARRHTTPATLDWAIDAALAQAARDVHRRGLAPDDLPMLQSLLSAVFLPGGESAAPRGVADGGPGQADLWALGVSGDHPILAVDVGDGRRTALLPTLLAGHRLWREGGARIDLALIYASESGYLDAARERLVALLREVGALELVGLRGGVHLVAEDPADARAAEVIAAFASVRLDVANGPLATQVAALRADPAAAPHFAAGGTVDAATPPPPEPARLLFPNGYGGFDRESGDYLIDVGAAGPPPAPWANVLANSDFGAIVTEAGPGWTWAINSGENRLTPWRNDPAADPQVEALYLRDEIDGRVWTPTPAPVGRSAPCRIRHAPGVTTWESESPGLSQTMRVFVAVDEPVKLVLLTLRNEGAQPRRLTATYYAEWLLGAVAGGPNPLCVSEYDPTAHAIFARNTRVAEFADRVAFLTATGAPHSVTTSRIAFLGPRGDMAAPAALTRWNLGEQRRGAGDACAAFQTHVDLAPGETAQLAFALGQGADHAAARALAGRWRDLGRVEAELDRVEAGWRRRLDAVQVRTPVPAFDLMVNRWLPVQTLGARVHARAGFYQAGGAFGFRDQLQDVLALLFAEPGLARAHLLRAAAAQFEAGDVLHWWHPPGGKGVRTRFSDDLLWLPYATAAYVAATGDVAVLAERASFLTAPPLGPLEHDRYARFDAAPEDGSLLEHCARALDRGHALGPDGLPLMGAGDWNDGMDRVGEKGRGRSIWLAWFLIATIRGFLDLCARAGREDLARPWPPRIAALAAAVEAAGWDGAWYLRAIDDDGLPWGSAANEECRIDSIAQSWAVISGAADPTRARMAMVEARRRLMGADDRLSRLLTPPFDATPRDPGYIKAYPPGVRENGGQYAHAAAWLGVAFAALGDGDAAKETFDRLNPILHAATRADAERYLTEPYAMAADIAGAAPHVGRGGWTWYTGAAGWTWRLGVEHILGLRLEDGALRLAPCLPAGWAGFEARLARDGGAIEVRVDRGDGGLEVDGGAWPPDRPIPFPPVGATLNVRLRLGPQRRESGQQWHADADDSKSERQS